MMAREHIDIFIDGVQRYFGHLDYANNDLAIGAPYLIKNNESLGKAYTGVITISGQVEGYVFFTANRSLLSNLLLAHGETQLSDAYMCDLVGEIANTIAGNARRTLGQDFHISTPKVLLGGIHEEMLEPERRSYILPLRWCSKGAQLIVSLNAA